MTGLNLAHIPPGAANVALGDGDEAGRKAMRKLAARAHAAGISSAVLAAPPGTDFADALEEQARARKGGAA